MNIFDGKDSHSDGKGNGPSATITSNGRSVNILVGGTFGPARVTLAKYYETLNKFFNTKAVWDGPNEFQTLGCHVGDKYQLVIESADSSTDIFAEVS